MPTKIFSSEIKLENTKDFLDKFYKLEGPSGSGPAKLERPDIGPTESKELKTKMPMEGSEETRVSRTATSAEQVNPVEGGAQIGAAGTVSSAFTNEPLTMHTQAFGPVSGDIGIPEGDKFLLLFDANGDGTLDDDELQAKANMYHVFELLGYDFSALNSFIASLGYNVMGPFSLDDTLAILAAAEEAYGSSS